jgi:polyketide cyclase/dehydrase/lipid transport protein
MAWTTKASAESRATTDQIWAAYEDVPGWTRWDHELDFCRLEGPFAQGSEGVLKPRGGPVSRFVLTAVEPGRSFADRTMLPHAWLPLAALEFEHQLTPLATGSTRIEHTVRISGILGPVVARLLGPKLVAGLPTAVRSLAALAASAA